MISRPYRSDYKLISHHIGRIIICVSFLYAVPLTTSIVFKEWDVVADFLLGFNACFIAGTVLLFWGSGAAGQLRWLHSMVVASLSWFLAMLLCAIPHYLSGHFASYLDSAFDVMSGFTTTGLVLVRDLDHAPHGLNMWRHLLTYVGGQGMIVLVLTLVMRGTSGAYMIYVGEGKDEKLQPNVIQTSRAIWRISIAYLILGTAVLFAVLSAEGIGFPRSLLHALWLFMSAWSTGGFAPQSQNMLYYHSFALETATLFFMIVGSFNFILHHEVWTRNVKEIAKNIEIRSFTATMIVGCMLLSYSLARAGGYGDAFAIIRRGLYILASGHTTTGFMHVYASQIIQDWGELAVISLIIVMVIGASACSTAGGIKGLRMGILIKGLWHEIRRIASTEDSVIITKFHHVKDIILTEQHVKMAGLIALCYVLMHLVGACIGSSCGYAFTSALFEAVSAGSNTGLSCGITAWTMPAFLKCYYIFAMWAGRLEFLALFGLIAFGISLIMGK